MIIKNKLHQKFILNLIEGRNVYLPAGGTTDLSREELESPQIQSLIQRGIIALRAEEAGIEISRVRPATPADPVIPVEPVTPAELVTAIIPEIALEAAKNNNSVITVEPVIPAKETQEPDTRMAPKVSDIKTSSVKVKKGNKKY